MLERLRRSAASARDVILPAAIAGVFLVAGLAGSVFRDVYYGIPEPIPVSAILATCQPDGGRSTCGVAIVRLNPGRFYLSTDAPAASLTVTIADAAAVARSRVLLVRPEAPAAVTIALRGSAGAFSHELPKQGERATIDAPEPTSPWNQLTFSHVGPRGPIVISELGFFPDRRGLSAPEGGLFQRVSAVSFYSTYAAAATLAVGAFLVAAAWLAPDVMRRALPALIGALCLAICLLDLGTMFSPHWSRDIRSMYGAELVRSGVSGNLTGGLYEGSRIVQGLGQTTDTATVPWHRMPGYGLFCAFAAVIGGTTDVVEIAMIVILLQMMVFAAAAAAFVVVARRLFGVPVACVLGVLIALLPKQVNYTEVDSIIAPLSLLVLSALIVTLSRTPAGEPPAIRDWLLLNGAFALWFLMRNDVLVGWMIVSLALAGWRWRRLAVPLTLAAAIALPWALYKRQYTHEFSLMPTNAGEVLFLSLCEVPGTFPYECTDTGYFTWAKQFSPGSPTSQRTSSLAVTEVMRHWVTYPVHFGFMILVKLRRCVVDDSWPGFRTRLSGIYSGVMRKGLFVCLLTLLGVAVAVDHQRRRSMMLGWPLVLNMPIFLLVFDSAGRFYAVAAVSLLVASVPLLFERGLAAQVERHPWRAAGVLACVALFMTGGPRVEGWVQRHDSVHYWALMDPGRSTLAFVTAR